MKSVFNTPFEISMRVLLMLSVDETRAMTIDMIAAVDFITIYGNTFEIADENLNGNNVYNFSEFALKRELMQKALRFLVLHGLVTVAKRHDGFRYGISTKGRTYMTKFNNDYADEYLAIVRAVIEHIGAKTEKEVFALINQRSTMSLQRGKLYN